MTPSDDSSGGSGDDVDDSTDLAFLRQVARGEAARDVPTGTTWAGPRFEVGVLIGMGAFGVVFEAFDRARGARVALKVPTRLDASALFRLKQEFRALADLVHPNLVIFHELHHHEGRWFFSMERVRGLDLLSWLRSTDAAGQRAALRQLALGLNHLHAARRVHRDIKPSNVVVESSGRVVVLDFGLALDPTEDPAAVAGTPRYLAPEAAEGTIGPAADWYAVGVLLHEALAGHPPFEGAEHRVGPVPPLPPSAPADLAALCHDLLGRDPAGRPHGLDVLARLGSPPVDMRPPPDQFVGRLTERAAVVEAAQQIRPGSGPFVVLIEATSGMGKTAFVSQCLADLRVAFPALVALTGRCLPHETLPYRALDGLIDSLARHLAGQVDLPVPAQAAALLRLFPALHHVPALHRAAAALVQGDAVELYRQAVAALAGLLRLRAEPLVLVVDDLHRGDTDGCALLADVLSSAEAPDALVLLVARTDADRGSPASALLGALAPDRTRRIPLPPLDLAEVNALAAPLLPHHSEAWFERLAQAAGGSPYLVRELCQFLNQFEHMPEQVSLDSLLLTRLHQLGSAERTLLELVAVGGRIDRRVVGQAARLGDDEPSAMALLDRHLWVTTGMGPAGQEVEAWHDRIREVVLAALEPAVRVHHHRSLAAALEATGRADPEVLATHLEGAGERARAAHWWAEAAQVAENGLAFEHAARLYRAALAGGENTQAPHLLARLGEVLSHAGRSAEAAAAFLAAAEGAGPAQATEFKRRAAQRLLLAGHLKEGLALLRPLLVGAGLVLPRTLPGALLRVVVQGLQLRWSGLTPRGPRRPPGPPPLALALDAAAGLFMFDPVRSIGLHRTALRWALQVGEIKDTLRALTTEWAFCAAGRGDRSPSSVQVDIERRVWELHRHLGPEELAWDGFVRSAEGVAHLFRGDLAGAQSALEAADARLAASPVQLANQQGLVRIWLALALWLRGDWRALADRLPGWLGVARDRDDRFARVHLMATRAFLELVADRPEAARSALAEAAAATPQYAKVSQVGDAILVALYADGGVGETALGLYGRTWNPIAARLMARISVSAGLGGYYYRGLALLAAAAARPGRVRSLERCARAVARVPTPLAAPHASVLLAGAALLRGRPEEAVAHLGAAEARCDALGLRMLGAVARRRRGQVLGDRALVEAADVTLVAEGVKQPARMAAVFLPGRWPSV